MESNMSRQLAEVLLIISSMGEDELDLIQNYVELRLRRFQYEQSEDDSTQQDDDINEKYNATVRNNRFDRHDNIKINNSPRNNINCDNSPIRDNVKINVRYNSPRRDDEI